MPSPISPPIQDFEAWLDPILILIGLELFWAGYILHRFRPPPHKVRIPNANPR